MSPPPRKPDDDVARVLAAAASASREIAQGDLFYRQLALHLAKDATHDFQRRRESRGLDGAAAVAAYVRHEEDHGRLDRKEITVDGEGLNVRAAVHRCPYAATCRQNLRALGEVPQCLRAITLIQAISSKIPERPPMTYELDPGLVDGLSDACTIELRPVGVAPIEGARP
ncbi:MAG: hypothetical protein HYT80_07765 [Euryarchaeota archaeon]|nr:hypothetical protein [Euryarchaeota archaeon]